MSKFTVSRLQPSSCTSFSLHYMKIPEANQCCDALHYSYITISYRIFKCTNFPVGQYRPRPQIRREKTDKEKSHKGTWPSDAPEASQGQTRDVPGTPGTFGPDLCVNQCPRDRMSPGQTGHMTGQMGRVPGTDGTHTRGCPAKILYVYCFFFFPPTKQGPKSTSKIQTRRGKSPFLRKPLIRSKAHRFRSTESLRGQLSVNSRALILSKTR